MQAGSYRPPKPECRKRRKGKTRALKPPCLMSIGIKISALSFRSLVFGAPTQTHKIISGKMGNLIQTEQDRFACCFKYCGIASGNFQRMLRTRLKFVLRVNTILGYHYQALTRLRSQGFDNRLDSKPRVGTPNRRSLLSFNIAKKISKYCSRCFKRFTELVDPLLLLCNRI